LKLEVIGFQLCAHYENNNGELATSFSHAKTLRTKLMVILRFIKAKKGGKGDKCTARIIFL
jgi:hypothetical protein